jgi:hypothetical protein
MMQKIYRDNQLIEVDDEFFNSSDNDFIIDNFSTISDNSNQFEM